MGAQLIAAGIYFCGAALAIVIVPLPWGFAAFAALAFLGGNALTKAFSSNAT